MPTKSRAIANREHRYIIKLTPEQKVYVVKRLATYDTPTAITRDLKALFGVDISVQAVDQYHPERASSDNLAPCWKELFWATRKAFIAACAEAGTMEQMVRVRLREDMALMARDAGHYRVANELLDSIAREAGKMFVSRHTLELAAAPAPMGLSSRIEYEYDDGTREVRSPGDPGGPLITIRKAGKKDDEVE
jgi:hypothetical protein